VLVTVAALMAVMMAMTIAPAFAARPVYRCTDPLFRGMTRSLQHHGLVLKRAERGKKANG
jgi:hypothetical protein